jgi:AraC family transcriptional activator FtrA
VPFFELGCAIEIFGLKRPEYGDWYDTKVVCLDSTEVVSANSIALSVDQVNDLSGFDTLIVPGWKTDNKKVKLSLAQLLTDFHQDNKRIISFCSGSFLLAQLGLLNGKQATTHWRYSENFKERFPQVNYLSNVLYTQQDNIFCSAGSAAGLDLSLEIVRQDFGHVIANQVARRLVVSPHRRGGQAQYVETPIAQNGNSLSGTLDWALTRLDHRIIVDDLANHANMSRRSFDRHFRAAMGLSPKAWLNQQRVNLAKRVIENKPVNLEQLAEQVGFENPVTLRFNFNKYIGVSPSQYQAQFSTPVDAATMERVK